jgi:hypothetical protein
VVFNTDFSLQVARDHQTCLRGERTATASWHPVRAGVRRRRVGAWIVRLGRLVAGAPMRRPALQP